MRLTKLGIVNYGSIGSLALDLAPLSLVVAPNGAGKSLACESIDFALTGHPGRAETKKGLPQLVREGADSGTVGVSYLLEGADQGCMRDVGSGKLAGPEPKFPAALPFVLRAAAFAGLPPDERRRFLFDLMGLSLGPPEIIKRLKARGISDPRISSIEHLLPGGFGPALTEAQNQARDSKGRWHEVTGENWGKTKGKTWVCKAPDYDAAALATVRDEYLPGWEAEKAKAQQNMGRLDQANKGREEIPKLKAKGQEFARHDADVQKLEAEYARRQKEIDALPQPAGGPQGSLLGDSGRRAPPQHAAAAAAVEPDQPCPECGCILHVDAARKIIGGPRPAAELPKEAPKPKEDRGSPQPDPAVATRARRDQLEKDQRECARQIAVAKGQVDACNKAISRADELEAIEIPADLLKAPQALADAQKEIDILQEDLKALEALETQAKQAKGKTDRAAELHADIESWEGLAAALSPDGVPAEILRDALGPLHQRLAAAAEATGWPEVKISEDMQIRIGGPRPYKLVSESQRWRADAMLAVSIAQLSGIKLVTLDRYDVLDIDGRGEALSWLYGETQDGELDSAILFGTLKSAPSMPPGAQAFWIGEPEAAAA